MLPDRLAGKRRKSRRRKRDDDDDGETNDEAQEQLNAFESCFPDFSKVITKSGLKKISELVIGEEIRTFKEGKEIWTQ